MVQVHEVIDDVLAQLPEGLQELVLERVHIEVRPCPTAEDLARGVGADWRGYFLGHQVGGGEDLDDSGERSRALEDLDQVEPGGTIAIFTDNVRPFTADHVREVFLHELAHFVGDSEDDVAADGLGCHDVEQLEVQAC